MLRFMEARLCPVPPAPFCLEEPSLDGHIPAASKQTPQSCRREPCEDGIESISWMYEELIDLLDQAKSELDVHVNEVWSKP